MLSRKLQDVTTTLSINKAFARGNSTSAKAPSEQNSSARVIMHILARIHESASALGMSLHCFPISNIVDALWCLNWHADWSSIFTGMFWHGTRVCPGTSWAGSIWNDIWNLSTSTIYSMGGWVDEILWRSGWSYCLNWTGFEQVIKSGLNCIFEAVEKMQVVIAVCS